MQPAASCDQSSISHWNINSIIYSCTEKHGRFINYTENLKKKKKAMEKFEVCYVCFHHFYMKLAPLCGTYVNCNYLQHWSRNPVWMCAVALQHRMDSSRRSRTSLCKPNSHIYANKGNLCSKCTCAKFQIFPCTNPTSHDLNIHTVFATIMSTYVFKYRDIPPIHNFFKKNKMKENE